MTASRHPPRACVFDAYGTLLDLASAVAPHAALLGDGAGPLLSLWRRKQLEYTWLRTLMGRHADFATVTRDALDYALEAQGLSAPDLGEALARSFRELGPMPGAAALLTRLRSTGIRTAVLSNGDPDMLRAALSHAGLASALDRVISVQSLGLYKPAPPVYQLATSALGLEPPELVFVSGNAWDAAGAASAGLRAILIEPAGTPPERLPAAPVARITTLLEVAAVVGAGAGAGAG
jgi:2-haloacid dehalogenase